MTNPLAQPLAQMIEMARLYVAKAGLYGKLFDEAWAKISAAQAALSANAEPSEPDFDHVDRVEAGDIAATVGEAGYPSASDLRATRPWWNWEQTKDATTDAIARLAIDLYRERVAKAKPDGGQVVAWRYVTKISGLGCAGNWRDGEPNDMDMAKARDERMSIQRAYDKPPAAQGFGPVVLTQAQRNDSGGGFPWINLVGDNLANWDAMPADERECYTTRELVVRQPVPADIIADAEWLVRWLPDESQQRTYALAIREWIRAVSA
jgi:hypothetical protein